MSENNSKHKKLILTQGFAINKVLLKSKITLQIVVKVIYRKHFHISKLLHQYKLGIGQ